MITLNHTPKIDMSQSKTGCCALIEPDQWDKQEFTFDHKLFAKARVSSIMHVPVNMSSVMSKTQELIDKADAQSDEILILSHETSPWHSDQYFSVTKEVEGLGSERLSGSFMTRVFEGPYKYAPRWQSELQDYVKSKGKKPVRTFFFYTTCPKCSKAYGKNYVVGFEQYV